MFDFLTYNSSSLITYTKQFIDFKEGLQVRNKYIDFFSVFTSVCCVVHGFVGV